MPTPIIFTITTAGRVAALDAFDNGLTIALTEIGIGDDSYTPTGSETALSNELDRFNLSGGTVESLSATLRFSAAITVLAHTEVYEIGLFSSTGVLFAVASTTSTTVPLTVAEANIDTICAFGMVLGDVPASSLTITLDPSAPLAIQLVNQHVGASNPHPQYATDIDLAAEASTRGNADTTLQNNIDTKANKNGISTEFFSVKTATSDNHAPTYKQLVDGLNTVSGSIPSISGKADLAGNAAQQFAVANATAGNSAVNLTTLLNIVYPVGSVYISKTDSRNPYVILGVGAWAAVDGKTLFGYKAADADFGIAGVGGGSKNLELTLTIDNRISATGSPPPSTVTATANGVYSSYINTGDGDVAADIDCRFKLSQEKILPPYDTFYIWERTA